MNYKSKAILSAAILIYVLVMPIEPSWTVTVIAGFLGFSTTYLALKWYEQVHGNPFDYRG